MGKVLIVIPNMDIGGAQRSLLAFLDSPVLQTHDVTVLLTVPGGVLEGLIPSNVRVVHGFNYYEQIGYGGRSLRAEVLNALKRKDLRAAGFRLRQGVYFKLWSHRHPEETIWRLVRRRVPRYAEHFDVCIAYMQGSTSYFVIEKLPNVQRKFLEFNTDFVKAGYSRQFNRKYFGSADGVVAVTESERRQLAQMFPDLVDRIHHIPYPLFVESGNRPGGQTGPDWADGDDFNGIRLVSVGRLELHAKGYDLLIEAANKLRAAGVEFRWYFVGPGSSVEAIRDLVRAAGLEDAVVLTGPLMDPFPLMKSADIFVHGSRFEGVPRAVREAMALGIPVVTTNYPAAVEEFADGYDCLITEMNSASITEAIMRLVTDPSLRARVVENALQNTSESQTNYEMLLNP